MIKSWLRNILLPVIFAMGVHCNAAGQSGSGPFFIHYSERRSEVPIAIYDGIRIEDFRKLVIAAFEQSGFSLVEVIERKDLATSFKFSYPMGSTKGVARIFLVVRVNENPGRKGFCGSCFLRDPELIGASSVSEATWMAQYELSSRIFPDMDRAFLQIQSSAKKYMNEKFGFNYRLQWKGEKNLFENSFVGARLPDLKALIVQSFRDAGFAFVGDDTEGVLAKSSYLTFQFPVDPESNAGAIYKVWLSSQFDADGSCHPCEVVESYDSHQSLPASGLMGMASRLTLESRFAASRILAYDKMKAATEKYLKPGSTFSVPPKQAPLGSPRPRLLPPVVT